MTDHSAEQDLPWRRGWLPMGLLAFFVVMASYFGYQQIFSTFASYDDEGYVMQSLAHYMSGDPLYDVTYSQYGPAFFQVQKLIHDVFEASPSHDFERFKTLAFWILIALVSGLSVWRLTQNAWFFAATFGVVFIHLDRLCLEPGHPQELCCLLNVLIIAIAAWSLPVRVGKCHDRKTISFAIIGAFIALSVLTKINVGVILGLSAALAMLLCVRKTADAGALLIFVVIASFGLIGLITYRGSFDPAVVALPIVVGISLVSVILIGASFDKSKQLSGFHLGVSLFGFASTLLFVLAVAYFEGTSIDGLGYGLIHQHANFGDFFFRAAPLHPYSILGALIGFVLAVVASQKVRPVVTLVRCAIIVLLFTSVMTALHESFSTPQTGFDDRGMAAGMISFATGLAWVILVPRHNDDSEFVGAGFGRLLLCTSSVMNPLIVYPTPGTQMAVGSVLLLVVGMVAFSDLIHGGIEVRDIEIYSPRGIMPVTILCLIVLSSFIVRGINTGNARNKMAFLDLPGALHLKLPQKRVDGIREVVTRLEQESDTFLFAENTRNSFYFWAQKTPPNAINATAWPFMFRNEQQRQIVDDIAAFERVLILRDGVDWPLPKNAPLTQWIDSNFEFDAKSGSFEIWTRKQGVELPMAESKTPSSPSISDVYEHSEYEEVDWIPGL